MQGTAAAEPSPLRRSFYRLVLDKATQKLCVCVRERERRGVGARVTAHATRFTWAVLGSGKAARLGVRMAEGQAVPGRPGLQSVDGQWTEIAKKQQTHHDLRSIPGVDGARRR